MARPTSNFWKDAAGLTPEQAAAAGHPSLIPGLNAREEALADYSEELVAAVELTPGPQGTQGIQGQKGDTGEAGASVTGPIGPAGPSISMKTSVANEASLPPTGNTVNDARLAEDTKHIWVWDGTGWNDAGNFQGPQGLPGDPGLSLSLKASVANAAALPSVGNSVNDARLTDDTGHLWSWSGLAWVDGGRFQGPQGIQGIQGIQGPPGSGTGNVTVSIADPPGDMPANSLWIKVDSTTGALISMHGVPA